MTLKELKVQSFITSQNGLLMATVKGGAKTTGPQTYKSHATVACPDETDPPVCEETYSQYGSNERTC